MTNKPPNYTASAKADDSAGVKVKKDSGKFSWTPENERKLLLFTHAFATVSTAEFEKLLEHFPGTNMNGIKIRYSRLRVEKTKLAEEYNFAGMGNSALTGEDGAKETPRKSSARGKKRAADGEDGPATPMKKGRKGKVMEGEAPSNDLGEVKKEKEDEI
ncbi:hypothetical protein SLS60_003157 [Paraconiothyrium brasiliense]|uniref:Myb-like domain-containing protein n=1 Tax=Paraconiothyrium brasiliense TaxID=300254 RepID=A0ABR3RVC7_9PLEO